MKVHTLGAAMVIAAMLAGCATPYSEAPLATNFPTTKQEKMQAAAHWNVIAKDVAAQISLKLAEQRPLHVAQPTGKSAFERAFANQLISSLVADGQTVMKQPADWFRAEFATGDTPQTEIIVTTSVSDGTRYLSRNTSVYYVADSDKALYEAAGTGLAARNIKISGGE